MRWGSSNINIFKAVREDLVINQTNSLSLTGSYPTPGSLRRQMKTLLGLLSVRAAAVRRCTLKAAGHQLCRLRYRDASCLHRSAALCIEEPAGAHLSKQERTRAAVFLLSNALIYTPAPSWIKPRAWSCDCCVRDTSYSQTLTFEV